jgi:SHAQKYF class myb-like DNA-binding protein
LSDSGDNSITDPNNGKVGRWTEKEHTVFLEGLEKHGKQWRTLAAMIGTRSVVQVRTHAQKYFQKMEKKKNSCSTSVSSIDSLNDDSDRLSVKRKSLTFATPSSGSVKKNKFHQDGATFEVSPAVVGVQHVPQIIPSTE